MPISGNPFNKFVEDVGGMSGGTQLSPAGTMRTLPKSPPKRVPKKEAIYEDDPRYTKPEGGKGGDFKQGLDNDASTVAMPENISDDQFDKLVADLLDAYRSEMVWQSQSRRY